MYLFLSDETNTRQSPSVQFLIFGAVIIPLNVAAHVAGEIQQIRQAAGYPATCEFKFNTRSRPPSVSKETFDAAKEKVLCVARARGVRFIACVVHHEIAGKIEARNVPLFALKTLLCEFDLFLSQEKTTGFCAVDRFEIAHSVLSSVLVGGVDPSGELGKFQRELKNIWLYAVTNIGCSYLCSLCDIVLGTFRYCVNATEITPVVKRLYPTVRHLFLTKPDAPKTIEDWGLFLRPKRVTVKRYADAYDNLRRHLAELEQ